MEHLIEELKEEKIKLKKIGWRKLVEELENNIWGQGYKVAMKSIENETIPFQLTKKKKQIINILFLAKKETVLDPAV